MHPKHTSGHTSSKKASTLQMLLGVGKNGVGRVLILFAAEGPLLRDGALAQNLVAKNKVTAGRCRKNQIFCSLNYEVSFHRKHPDRNLTIIEKNS